MLKLISKLSVAALVIGAFALSSCKKDNVEVYDSSYKVSLQLAGSQKTSADFNVFYHAVDTVVVKLSKTLKSDLTISLVSNAENISNYVSISPKEVTIKAGQNSAKFAIDYDSYAKALKSDVHLMLKPVSFTKGIMVDPFSINIIANTKANLTAEQATLINYYRETYHIDILPLLGTYSCSGQIVPFYEITKDGEENTENESNKAAAPIALTNQSTVISLSPLADKNNILLAMTKNAFGLNDMFTQLYNGNTIFCSSFNSPDVPASSAIIKDINWLKTDPGTVNVSYYTLQINSDNSNISVKNPIWKPFSEIQKLPNQANTDSTLCELSQGADDMFIPFSIQSSIWNKVVAHSKTLQGEALTTFQTNCKQSQICPMQVLFGTTVDSKSEDFEDEDDPNNPMGYETPNISYDPTTKSFTCKLITSTNGAVGGEYGYTQMNIKMTKVEASK